MTKDSVERVEEQDFCEKMFESPLLVEGDLTIQRMMEIHRIGGPSNRSWLEKMNTNFFEWGHENPKKSCIFVNNKPVVCSDIDMGTERLNFMYSRDRDVINLIIDSIRTNLEAGLLEMAQAFIDETETSEYRNELSGTDLGKIRTLEEILDFLTETDLRNDTAYIAELHKRIEKFLPADKVKDVKKGNLASGVTTEEKAVSSWLNGVKLEGISTNIQFKQIELKSFVETVMGASILITDQGQIVLNEFDIFQSGGTAFLRDSYMNLDEFDLLFNLCIDALTRVSLDSTVSPYKHYLIRSPTGTGKTFAYMAASIFCHELYKILEPEPYNSFSTVIYTNNATIATQVAEEYLEHTKLIPCVFEHTYDSTSNTFKVSLKVGSKTLDIYDQNGNYEIDMEVFDFFGSEQIFTKYIIKDDGTFINMHHARSRGLLGDILIAPFECAKLLQVFGVLDPTMSIKTVIYDEVDVFYNALDLHEFHRLFMSTFENCKAKTVIFASATVDKELVQYRDVHLSKLLKEEEEKYIRLSSCLEISPATAATSTTMYTSHNLFTFQKTNDIITDESDIMIILTTLWERGGKYVYYDIENFKQSYIKMRKDGNSFKMVLDGQVVPESEIDSNLLRLEGAKCFASDFKLQYLPFRECIPESVFRDFVVVNNLKDYKPNIMIEYDLKKLSDHDSIWNHIEGFCINQERLLVMHFLDPFIIKQANDKLSAYKWSNSLGSPCGPTEIDFREAPDTSMFANIEKKTVELNQFLKAQGYKKKVDTPFEELFYHNSTISNAEASFEPRTFVNLRQVGRGVDIKDLFDCVILLPATIKWEELGFDRSEFMQSVGRVGRFGKTGKVKIFLYGIPVDVTNNAVDFDTEIKSNSDLLFHYSAAYEGNVNASNWSEVVNKLLDNADSNIELLEQWIAESEYYNMNNAASTAGASIDTELADLTKNITNMFTI